MIDFLRIVLGIAALLAGVAAVIFAASYTRPCPECRARAERAALRRYSQVRGDERAHWAATEHELAAKIHHWQGQELEAGADPSSTADVVRLIAQNVGRPPRRASAPQQRVRGN